MHLQLLQLLCLELLVVRQVGLMHGPGQQLHLLLLVVVEDWMLWPWQRLLRVSAPSGHQVSATGSLPFVNQPAMPQRQLLRLLPCYIQRHLISTSIFMLFTLPCGHCYEIRARLLQHFLPAVSIVHLPIQVDQVLDLLQDRMLVV